MRDRVIDETLGVFGRALETTPVPQNASPALKDRLGYNLDRIAAGRSIGKPKLPLQTWKRVPKV